ncbi:response regulator transcription factor [Pseudonocardia spinosispora]|uniref:response regulator transcription factor n=1 Tax=Pseudonocardia spinosispora TaxID=103441 RepID=UPI00040943C7|nr:response regulator transcription factor [Pseudonocardia spinosispora]
MDESTVVDAVAASCSTSAVTSAEGLLKVLLDAAHGAAAAVTYVDGRTGRHHELATVGYAPTVARYLLTDFVDRDPGYRLVARSPGVPMCWADLPSYRDGYSAREILTPHGYREGSSTCLARDDGKVVGAVHLSVVDEVFPAAGKRGLDVLRGVLTERVAEMAARAAIALTPREVEILRLITQGRTNTEICAELVLSRSTVATHVEHILRKLSATNRVEAAVKAIRLSLCPF